jgi:Zn-dependent protease with chaperone function
MKKIMQIDRVFILIAIICLIVILVLIRPVTIGYDYLAGVIFLFSLSRILPYLFHVIRAYFKNKRLSSPDVSRTQEASKMLSELVYAMRIENKQIILKVVPRFNGAQSDDRTIEFGSLLLNGLGDTALRGTLAHELGHIKSGHSKKEKNSLLVFVPAVLFLLISSMSPRVSEFSIGIMVLLFLVGLLVWSLLSWNREFEADDEAAECVGQCDMTRGLHEISTRIYRPWGTLEHPSFKNRILRLSPDSGFSDKT